MKIDSIVHITIEEDGWVWIATKDGTHEKGLGDINVDVFIKDKRRAKMIKCPKCGKEVKIVEFGGGLVAHCCGEIILNKDK